MEQQEVVQFARGGVAGADGWSALVTPLIGGKNLTWDLYKICALMSIENERNKKKKHETKCPEHGGISLFIDMTPKTLKKWMKFCYFTIHFQLI